MLARPCAAQEPLVLVATAHREFSMSAGVEVPSLRHNLDFGEAVSSLEGSHGVPSDAHGGGWGRGGRGRCTMELHMLSESSAFVSGAVSSIEARHSPCVEDVTSCRRAFL